MLPAPICGGTPRIRDLQATMALPGAAGMGVGSDAFRPREAERSDHRKLGRDLDVFHGGEEAVGSVFWHPKGWTLFRVIEDYMRMRLHSAGYLEIKRPQPVARTLWGAS